MKKSLVKIGNAVFKRLAKELDLNHISIVSKIDLDWNNLKDCDIYLYDWKYGFTKIESPESNLGNAILSAISKKATDFRTETPRFSHIGIHNKIRNTLIVNRFIGGVNVLNAWRSQLEFELSQGDYENQNIHSAH